MRRILLVDDEPAIAEVLGVILREAGYEVSAAANGAEALDIASRWQPHLVLSDWMMPRMDGEELLSRLKQSESLSHVPVVVMSAVVPDPKFPLAGVLQKPFAMGLMLDTIAHCLQSKESSFR